jgi:hypothetical protein
MTKEYGSSVTLVILDTDLNPDLVSARLGLQPDRFWENGDVSKNHTYKWGGWKKFVPDEIREEYVEDQLLYWATLLESKTKVLRSMSENLELVTLDCFIGLDETASIIVPHTLQKSICDLGIEVRFSIST